MFDASDPSPEYELDWPRELFVDEATAHLKLSDPSWFDDAELLLEEAFTGIAPKDDLRTTKYYDLPRDLFKDPASAGTKKVAHAFLTHLVNSADKLPERSERRPYWSARRTSRTSSTQTVPLAGTDPQLQQDWVHLVEDFQARGYLDWVAPRGCVVVAASLPVSEVLAAEFKERLGMDVAWPLRNQDWDSDTFYSLVEVVHDLVTRPRRRYRHDISGCSWHYSDFAPTPGQALYRWDVYQLLESYGAGLQLAADGEDKGRLVHAAGDNRDELVEQVLQTRNPGDRKDVRHAIALYRNRNADRESKRSAVVALHRVLEGRRSLIKTELMSKDEGALFQIANEFDLRHSGGRQRTDYEDAYLDWIFWWYLATVELTDRIVASQLNTT